MINYSLHFAHREIKLQDLYHLSSTIRLIYLCGYPQISSEKTDEATFRAHLEELELFR